MQDLRRHAVQEMMGKGSQVVEVLAAEEFRRITFRARSASLCADRDRVPEAGQGLSCHPVLLGLGLRPEPTSRVAARRPRFHAGVRLHGRQTRLVGDRLPTEGTNVTDCGRAMSLGATSLRADTTSAWHGLDSPGADTGVGHPGVGELRDVRELSG